MHTIRTIGDLAAAIRGRRLENGWTQAELADRAHVSRSWLIGVEAAKKPSAEVGRILRVLDALGIDLRAVPAGTGKAGPATSLDLDAHLERYRS
ncbi:MAG: helix-turn-helix transcriptional regulator [Acidimicrobiia bacterium]|nr:helix-turn-helix transcriptional regulator [Acidimicrobiia bacterium]